MSWRNTDVYLVRLTVTHELEEDYRMIAKDVKALKKFYDHHNFYEIAEPDIKMWDYQVAKNITPLQLRKFEITYFGDVLFEFLKMMDFPKEWWKEEYGYEIHSMSEFCEELEKKFDF